MWLPAGHGSRGADARWPWRWWCCGARGVSGRTERPRRRRLALPLRGGSARRGRGVRRADPAGGIRRQAVLGLLIQVAYLEGVVTGIELGVPAGTAGVIAATRPLLVAAAGPDRTSVGNAGDSRWVSPGSVSSSPAISGPARPRGGRSCSRPPGRWRWPRARCSSGGGAPGRRRSTGTRADGHTAAAGRVAATRRTARPPADPAFWWAVAWTVGLSSFGGYGAYLLMLRRAGAMRTSTLLFLTPPVTTVGGAMFGQAPGPLALPGAIGAAVGAALVLAPPRLSRSASRTRRGPCPSSPGLPPTGARP